MQKLLTVVLKILAQLTLIRFQPKIVGVTGSVGKTSAKEAIFCVLSKKYRVRASLENYNNEIGVPLSILGEKSAEHNILIWLWVIFKGILKLIYSKYPEILVLEMAVDRPGDMGYLVKIVRKLDLAVITNVGISHLEFFSNPAALMREKLGILQGLGEDGKVIVNSDDSALLENIDRTKYRVVGFGFKDNSLIKASDFQLIKKDGFWGVNFKIHYQGTVVPVFIPNTLGRPAIYSALAASAVALDFGLNLVDVSSSLQKFVSPAGRLKLIAGIKHTQILDDSYNASPDSTIVALEALNLMAQGRKVAVLGSMTELGKESERGHKEVAAKLMEFGATLVFLIGSEARIIESELRQRKFAGQVRWFATSDEARLEVQKQILPADTILVKGSQAVRVEKVVKEIMAEPLKAKKLLVRQSESWKDK
ncbi:MAG: hypothetical protein HYW51_01585 [Candidatus Doudnabacteria bacterium]|nr:hypothetical protein [Candidatus Doudnabacteria bacterium]